MDGTFKDDIELIATPKKCVTFLRASEELSTGLDECDEENATTLSVDTVKFEHV
jgi:hypothetical protein